LLVSFLNDSEGAASEPDAIGGEVWCGRTGAEKVFGDEQRLPRKKSGNRIPFIRLRQDTPQLAAERNGEATAP